MTNIAFVYGSLKKGCHNDGFLAGSASLGTAVTAARYLLLSGYAYPFLINPNGLRTMTNLDGMLGRVRGEVYAVDGATLAALDRLEGHPTFYKRELIDVTLHGARLWAWAYFLQGHEPSEMIAPHSGLRRCIPDADGIVEWNPRGNEAAFDTVEL